MPVNLSIKNVPDELAEKLRARAADHRRSLQGELLVILEEAVMERSRLTPNEVLNRVRRLGIETEEEATRLIRADRDGR
jgi:plasmid stability protein